MHEVTETSSIALAVFVLTAAGFTKIGDRGEFCV
jgi:hypothetical protein